MGLEKILCFVCLFVVFDSARTATTTHGTHDVHAPSTHDLVLRINSMNTSWSAAEYNKDLHRKTSSSTHARGVPPPHNVTLPARIYNDTTDVPVHFDARTKWPNCPSLHEIRDQSNCGSCWAHSTAEAITDRICIATNGSFTADISVEDLLTCCTKCGRGCFGGQPDDAWSYYISDGLVTGGLYNGTGCRPYTIENGHHGEQFVNYTPSCVRTCANGANYTQDKHFGKTAYSLTTIRDMQRDIMEHGPIVTEFAIYADFYQYKSGIYQRLSDDYKVLHDVKIMGWGHEDGLDYWLVANSWNSSWGEAGFFRIRRGTNEAQFEQYVTAGIPNEG